MTQLGRIFCLWVFGWFALALPAQAAFDSSIFDCGAQNLKLSWQQQHRLFSFSAQIEQLLADSGRPAALISRTGTDLSQFGLRYSHMGVVSLENPLAAWGVTELFYECSAARPYLFDQDLTSFVAEQRKEPVTISIVFPSPERAALLYPLAAKDRTVAKALLDAHYSANAYAYATTYQNCNQWVVELLAAAWAQAPINTRAAAQAWLKEQGYAPGVIRWQHWWQHLVPWFTSLLNDDDHPAASQGAYFTSTPESIESFVHQFDPAAQRVEICMTPEHMVIHQGWSLIDAACQGTQGDQVIGY